MGKISSVVCFLLAFLLFSTDSYSQDRFEFTVAPDGSGDFILIQQAIDASKAFPDRRVTIYVKNGIYNEKIVVPSCNTRLSIIGEDPLRTIITWNDHFNSINRGRNSTFYTYTLLVEADDFYAENLTIRNTAGPVGQAVALHVEGTRCVFRNCHILGHQDTLYTGGQDSRQYYDNCHIEGTTDFIFGAATALFNNCTICSLGNSFITAASTPAGKAFGYVFLNCRLTALEGVNRVYLGRPWRDFARVAFIGCEMGTHIAPEGWANWDGTGRDRTAWYAEYGNTGPGAVVTGRVAWSHPLGKREASKYTIERVLSPSSGKEMPVEQWITGKE
jgi:pectinesterase